MSGTKLGGLKAAETNKEKHGEDFYREIGRKGGRACCAKGFAANRELARSAGAKGGAVSRRGKPHTLKKDYINGKEITRIIVRKITTRPQKVRVKHVN